MLILLLGQALADPLYSPELVAPGFTELEHAKELSAERIAKSEAISTPVVRVHNRLGVLLREGSSPACDDELLGLLARTPRLIDAWRSAAQSARAELSRLEQISRSPTLELLLSESDKQQILDLSRAAEAQVPIYLEALSWQEHYVDPLLAKCKPDLAPGPGLENPLGKPDSLFVVMGSAPGYICPGDHPAENVVVLSQPEACFSESDCACFTSPVVTGAVLGPEIFPE